MSRISSCSACHGDITIPGWAQPASQMRCPLCGAQFVVHDLLATSILAPPEALPVEMPPPDIRATLGARRSQVDEAPAVDGGSVRGQGRPKRKEPGALAHLIGIVGGGVLGLTLGYLGLLRFGGRQYDFLDVADRLPRWAVAPVGRNPAELIEATGRGLKDLLRAADEPAGEGAPAAGAQPPPSVEVPDAKPPALDPPTPPADPLPTDAASPGGLPSEPVPPASSIPPAPQARTSPVPPAPLTADPAAREAPRPGPRHFRPATSQELELALADVAVAIGCEACQSTGLVSRTVVTGTREVNGQKVEQTEQRRKPCDVCGGKPGGKITPDVYERLCHLAEAATFVEATPGDQGASNQREATQRLLAAAAADPARAETIGRLAGFQLESRNRRQNGVALAGTVQEVGQEGGLHSLRIVLFGLPKVVTVVSWRAAQPALKPHDRVLILGGIIDNPAENLAGYEGRQPQIVWGGLPVKLAAAAP